MKYSKRLMIYVHYHLNNEISDRVYYTLEKFRAISVDIVFISTSSIIPSHLARLRKYAREIYFVENIGYDFYAWKVAIEKYKEIFPGYDRLILINSSIVGPIFDLSNYIQKLDNIEKDIVGATISYEEQFHVQSYFFYFSRRVFLSECFFKFWKRVQPINDRQQVINNYEIKMTRYFLDNNFQVGAFYESKDKLNPTIHHPYKLLCKRMPFVKKQLLRDNPAKIWIWPYKLFLYLLVGKNLLVDF